MLLLGRTNSNITTSTNPIYCIHANNHNEIIAAALCEIIQAVMSKTERAFTLCVQVKQYNKVFFEIRYLTYIIMFLMRTTI